MIGCLVLIYALTFPTDTLFGFRNRIIVGESRDRRTLSQVLTWTAQVGIRSGS
jgi:hypothetical protein